jgi:hypothetical protein
MTSARSSRGTWALYPTGPEVLVVHPDGTVSGSAAEVGRLAAHDLDRQAAQTIQHLLTGDGTDHAGPRLLGARTWAIPAKAYWLSGPDNHHVGLRRRRAGPFHTGPPHPPRDERSRPGRRVAAGPVPSWAAGSHLPKRSVLRTRRSPLQPRAAAESEQRMSTALAPGAPAIPDW